MQYKYCNKKILITLLFTVDQHSTSAGSYIYQLVACSLTPEASLGAFYIHYAENTYLLSYSLHAKWPLHSYLVIQHFALLIVNQGCGSGC